MRQWITTPALRPFWLIIILILPWDLAYPHLQDPAVPDPDAWRGRRPDDRRMAAAVAREPVTTYATLGRLRAVDLFGIPMAMLIAYSRTVESFVYPLLVFSQTIPKIAIAPLFVVWFGFGVIPQGDLRLPARLLPDRRRRP